MSCSGVCDMQMTALMLNNVSYYSFKFGRASKGFPIYPLINTVNAFFKNCEILILSIIKQKASAVFNIILLTRKPIGFPLRYRA